MIIAGRYDPAEDMRMLRAAVECLEDYLLSDVLYWPLEGGSRARGELPALTVANLLIAQARLGAVALPPEKAEFVQRKNRSLLEIRRQWTSAWKRKAEHEFDQRLNLWERALNEISSDSKYPQKLFAQDARWRVLLEFLLPEIEDKQKIAHLGILDTRLRALSKPEHFIWSAELEGAFPLPRFWFLYLQINLRK